MASLFVRKSIQDCEQDIRERGGLSRSLNKWHLTALGVGATIGAGIFAATGTAIVGDAARPGAGPAIVLSFLLTAIGSGNNWPLGSAMSVLLMLLILAGVFVYLMRVGEEAL